MMCEREAFHASNDSVMPSSVRACVRRALSVRRAGLHAVAAAAGIASVTPLALGAAFPPVFPLGSLHPAGGGDGSRGFVISGINSGDFSGGSVSDAGDINGDGIDDLVIGSGLNVGFMDDGETYVVFGSTQGFPAVFPLATLSPAGGGDGTRGFVLVGIDDPEDHSGFPVSAAGDVNGDGIDDLIIGARWADPRGENYAGESYVVFGSTQGFPAVFPLASLYPAGGGDGSRGFVLTGVDSSDHSGSVSAAGDINGDGIDDLVIGAYGTNAGGGAGFVVFGSTQGFPPVFPLASLHPSGGGDGSRGFVLTGISQFDSLGYSASAAGDVNADGTDDLIIGAPEAYRHDDPDVGESYVVFGSTQGFPAVFPLPSLFPGDGGDGSLGFVLAGIDRNDYAGRSVSAAGDVNGDGIDDVVVGASNANARGGDNNDGQSYVVFGSTQAFEPVIPLASLFPGGGGDGSRGFVLGGIDESDLSGISVSAAGDLNADGIDDVIIGAVLADPRGVPGAGESYVVFGSTLGFPAVFPLASLHAGGGGDGSRGFVLTGIHSYDQSGGSVSAAGDVNGDGIDDVVIGASGASPGGKGGAGESYVVFGRADAP